jgi:hypothetical protein
MGLDHATGGTKLAEVIIRPANVIAAHEETI